MPTDTVCSGSPLASHKIASLDAPDPAIRLLEPRSEAEWRHARTLIEEYAASLDVDLCFQDLDHELEHLAQMYGPPGGAFLLAEEAGSYLGCVGVRRFDEMSGEVKRLYCTPLARGRGVGRLLAQAIIAAGRRLGYRRLLLDTLPSMTAARRLYASLGFETTTAYCANPVPGTAYLVLELR
jgi:GNAT superfamily N-acetyltransferase